MKLMTIDHIDQLDAQLLDGIKLIIVEGYDNVGKGRVIRDLVSTYGWKVYRPDYSYWNTHIDRKQRWLIFRSFFDVYKVCEVKEPIIIDRGMLSGAVYNHNDHLASEYADLIKDEKVFHILVTTDKDSYYKMQGVRLGEAIPRVPYALCSKYTMIYRRYLDEFQIPYVEFTNVFSNKIGHKRMGTCGGCDSWNAIRQDYDSEKVIGYCGQWRTEMPEDGERCPFYERGDEHAAK